MRGTGGVLERGQRAQGFCVCVCVSVCVYTCMRVCMNTADLCVHILFVCVYERALMCVSLCTHEHAWGRGCLCVPLCVPLCVRCVWGCHPAPHPFAPSSMSPAPTLGHPELPQPEGPPEPPLLLAGPERPHWVGIAAPRPSRAAAALAPACRFSWENASQCPQGAPSGAGGVPVEDAHSAPGLSMAQLPLPPIPALQRLPPSLRVTLGIFPGQANVGWAGRAAGPGPQICCAHGWDTSGASDVLSWELPCP